MNDREYRRNVKKRGKIILITILLLTTIIASGNFLIKKINIMQNRMQVSQENMAITRKTTELDIASNMYHGGYSYIYDNSLYLCESNRILKMSIGYKNVEIFIEAKEPKYLSIDAQYLYYVDKQNNLRQVDIDTKDDRLIIKNVNFIRYGEENIYYQKGNELSLYVYNKESQVEEQKEFYKAPGVESEIYPYFVVDDKEEWIYYKSGASSFVRENLNTEVIDIYYGFDITTSSGMNSPFYIEDNLLFIQYPSYYGYGTILSGSQGIVVYNVETKDTLGLVVEESNLYDFGMFQYHALMLTGGKLHIVGEEYKNKTQLYIEHEDIKIVQVHGDKVLFLNNDTWHVRNLDGNYGELELLP